MTWLQRYRASNFVRSSVWLPPVVGMLAALLLQRMIQRADLALGWQSSVGPDGARAVGIARDFRDPEDQVRAASPDPLGV